MVVGIGRDVIKFLALYASTLIAFALCFHIASNQKVRLSIHTDVEIKVKLCKLIKFGQSYLKLLSKLFIGTFQRPTNFTVLRFGNDGWRVQFWRFVYTYGTRRRKPYHSSGLCTFCLIVFNNYHEFTCRISYQVFSV